MGGISFEMQYYLYERFKKSPMIQRLYFLVLQKCYPKKKVLKNFCQLSNTSGSYSMLFTKINDFINGQVSYLRLVRPLKLSSSFCSFLIGSKISSLTPYLLLAFSLYNQEIFSIKAQYISRNQEQAFFLVFLPSF